MTRRVLFVCLGNICRSPAAEGVLRAQLVARGLDGAVEVDSAGTGGWHAGQLADPRMRAAAARRGLALTHRARQLRVEDLNAFDEVLVMDDDNLANVALLGGGGAHRARVQKFSDFAPPATHVPDPYYGSEADFESVLDLLERATQGWLATLTEA
ncbi:MAG: hypothetical protein RLZZ383_2869 [Pseudomonadota bacterium]|jgi:protein-tyrosine phosphatase